MMRFVAVSSLVFSNRHYTPDGGRMQSAKQQSFDLFRADSWSQWQQRLPEGRRGAKRISREPVRGRLRVGMNGASGDVGKLQIPDFPKHDPVDDDGEKDCDRSGNEMASGFGVTMKNALLLSSAGISVRNRASPNRSGVSRKEPAGRKQRFRVFSARRTVFLVIAPVLCYA